MLCNVFEIWTGEPNAKNPRIAEKREERAVVNREDPRRLFHRHVNKPLFAVIFILICSLSLPDAHSQAMTRTGTITLNGSYVDTAVIDQNSGQAYFGTESGTIVRIDLSTFTQTGVLNLSEGGFSTAVIDSRGGFAYFGTDSFPARIVKIDLSNFSPTGVRTFLGASKFTSAFLGTNDYVYFVGYCEPNSQCTYAQRSMILKIDLSKFESVGILVLGGTVGLSAITAYDYAYLGAYDDGQRIGEIIEVDLSTLTTVATLTLGQMKVPRIGVIDSYGSSAYFLLSAGPYDEPKSIVKVDLSSLTSLAKLTPAGNLGLGAIAIDSARNIAYIGTDTVPGRILKVELATFKLVETLVLDKGEDNVVSAIVDAADNLAYFGTHTSPGKIVRVALAFASTTTTSATSTAISTSANSTAMSSVATEQATSGTTANETFSATTSTSSPQNDLVTWTAVGAIASVALVAVAIVTLYRQSRKPGRNKRFRRAAPIKFEISQRMSNETKRLFPSVGFKIHNEGDSHLKVRVFAETFLDGKSLGYPLSDPLGHYNGSGTWNLNARRGVIDGNFTIPLTKVEKDQRLMMKVTVQVINRGFDSPLPLGWVYMRDQDDWFLEPSV